MPSPVLGALHAFIHVSIVAGTIGSTITKKKKLKHRVDGTTKRMFFNNMFCCFDASPLFPSLTKMFYHQL